jgi:ArsR family transcriptional regulator, cadmium/lead-responsive transcriptional repressor
MKAVETSTVEVPVSETAAPSTAACMSRSPGDPTRLAILRHLALGEHKSLTSPATWGCPINRLGALAACATVVWSPPARTP